MFKVLSELELTEYQLELLESFYNIHKTAKLNLTSIKDREEFYIKHYLDSLYFFKLKKVEVDKILDVGSGGGFPGIPLAIYFPNAEVKLVESVRKKAIFLSNTINELGLENVTVINDRVENLSEKYDGLITVRGVARFDKVFDLLERILTKRTKILFYKGENLKEELVELKRGKNKKINMEAIRVEEPFKRTYCFFNNINNK